MRFVFNLRNYLTLYQGVIAGPICLLLLLTVTLTACADNTNRPETTSTERIKAVATTTQIADMLKSVGGERVEVTTLVKGDGWFSEYIPIKPDLKAVETARVIFKNGAGLDDWLTEIYQSTHSKAVIVDLSEGIRLLDYKFQKSPPQAKNPYYWLAPANGKPMVDHIARILGELDKPYSQDFAANAKTFHEQLDQVVERSQALLGEIPANQRKLLTGSEAMAYFAGEFGLEFLEPLFSSESCNSPQVLTARLTQAQLTRLQEVPAIFFDRLCNPHITQWLNKVAATRVILDLYTESLSLPGREVDTYLRMLLNNALVISLGLH